MIQPFVPNAEPSTEPSTKPSINECTRQLEQRRQQAWAIAQHCEQVLQKQFGAERVIVFGSLAGHSIWHQDSDLDIAVAGLSDQRWLQAYDYLQNLAPDWLKIDLVRLETVNPLIRDRILHPDAMPQNPYALLKKQLNDELTALEQSAIALGQALERAKPTLENYDIRALASYINDFYKRCERMSERVAVTLDGGLPQGINWHQTLLRQVADAVEQGRPALWSGSLLLDLDEYRKFRHVIHHKYGEELKADYVVALAEMAPAVLVKVQQAIATFDEWLSQQGNGAVSP
ncbi:MAG TPA: nucleotidyltransferase domain-containing protein [Chroococcidiopsis sp.]